MPTRRDADRPTTVVLVRHGQAKRFTHAADAGLTELGRRQAAAATAQLCLGHAPHGVDAVYTSATRRAVETAAVIAQGCGVGHTVDARLRERAEFPQDADMPLPDFLAMWERASRERAWQPPVGDSAAACGLRMAGFLDACRTQWPGATLVAVSHGGAIADLLLHLFTTATLAAVNPALAARPYDGTVLRECSLTGLEVGDAGTSLRAAAQGDHLPC